MPDDTKRTKPPTLDQWKDAEAWVRTHESGWPRGVARSIVRAYAFGLSAGAEKAEAERDEARARLARVEEWTRKYGGSLKPAGADTYGEGVRAAKAAVAAVARREGEE